MHHMTPTVQYHLTHPLAIAPAFKTSGAAAADLSVYETVTIGDQTMVDFGVTFIIPEGYVGLMTVRSSLGKAGIQLANQVGVIDSDYRGTVKAVLNNLTTSHEIDIEAGSRVCQIMFVPVLLNMKQVDVIPQTERGDGGFGSTGK
jgi:dUTP pyrophosphatase